MNLEARIDKTISDAIAGNSIVGAVTIVARDGDILYRKAAGHFDREAGKPMFPEAIFRLASITKPIVAATALAMVERSLLGLDNAVADHLPWFRPKLADGTEPKITIRQLLTHTSGLVYGLGSAEGVTAGLEASDLSLEENFGLLAKSAPLAFAPGSGWGYGMSIDVLGAVIARLHGGTLADAVGHYITGPLRMVDTGFSVTDPDRLAVPYADGPERPLRMSDPQRVEDRHGAAIQFSPGRIFSSKAFQSGGAGAAGTADDLFRFFEAIRSRGGTILKPESVAQGIQNQVGNLRTDPSGIAQGFGYFGAVKMDPPSPERPSAAGSIAWGGAYGHDWFVDFANGIVAVKMTNTAFEGTTGQYPLALNRAIYGT